MLEFASAALGILPALILSVNTMHHFHLLSSDNSQCPEYFCGQRIATAHCLKVFQESVLNIRFKSLEVCALKPGTVKR
jgi:hypothetical protein